MAMREYNVFMNTPLGKRYGKLIAQISGTSVSGQLDILNHHEPFSGTIDAFGNCRITGSFVTLMRRVMYTATGQLTESSVHLHLKGGSNIYELSGVSDPEREEFSL